MLFAVAALFITSVPAPASAMEVGVWVPWFADETGAERAEEKIEQIDVLYPFVFEADIRGNLINKVDFEDQHWEDLLEAAKDNDVEVIPTVAWFDGEAIDEVLSNKTKRKKHINEIVTMLEDNDFDGVNIDYEQKKSETKNDFSAFLKELNTKLRGKALTCAIEARTPPDSLYKEVPKNLEYSNDYSAIDRYCDRVEIMTYDQQRADIKLNTERRGVPYMPVADKVWVEKVIKLAVKEPRGPRGWRPGY